MSVSAIDDRRLTICLSHHDGGAMKAFQEYQEKRTGVFAGSPFGAFAYARLDDRLKDEPLWKKGNSKPGLDPANMHSDQAHIEMMHILVSPKALKREP